jgi:hypothetical protein
LPCTLCRLTRPAPGRSASQPGEAELAQAWETFTAAAAAAASDESARSALDAFLDAFVARAACWAPAEAGALRAVPPHLLPAAPQLPQAAPRGCASGHPSQLLRALADAAHHAAAQLEQGARSWPCFRVRAASLRLLGACCARCVAWRQRGALTARLCACVSTVPLQ